MNETKKKPGILKLAVILFAIAAITSLVLGLVNQITKDRIAAITAEKTAAAMSEVLAADTYTPVTYTGDNSLVTSVYQAGEDGWVVQVDPSGFGGAIDMVVGVSTDGTVTGVSIIDQSETSGLGANAVKSEFRDQYVGGSGPFAVTKDGGTIQALTGATITSRAVTRGVNAALEVVQELS